MITLRSLLVLPALLLAYAAVVSVIAIPETMARRPRLCGVMLRRPANP